MHLFTVSSNEVALPNLEFECFQVGLQTCAQVVVGTDSALEGSEVLVVELADEALIPAGAIISESNIEILIMDVGKDHFSLEEDNVMNEIMTFLLVLRSICK